MKLLTSFFCVVAVADIFGANAVQVEVTPVKKVMVLLSSMLEKAKKEKHEEQVLFASQRQLCKGDQEKTTLAIEEEVSAIEGLEAGISKNSADANHFTRQIAVSQKDQDTWSGDIKAATKVREIEQADYENTHKDYSESIEAIEHAVSVMKKQTHDRKQASEETEEKSEETEEKAEEEPASALVQLSALRSLTLTPGNTKKIIDSLLQQNQTDAPEANAYEFQSHGVIDMLEKLQEKFVKERTQLEKEEVNSKHAYEMLLKDLEAQIAHAEKDSAGKTASKTKRLEAKADEEADLKTEETLKDDDSKSLADLKADCEMKASDFEARQTLRAGEIKAIEQAVEVLSDGGVAEKEDKHLTSFLQTKGGSLWQLRSSLANNGVQGRVSLFLRAQAAKVNSKVLAIAAVRIAEDPFGKVKKMLKDLVVRLLEEANEESDHKGWCDSELSTNGQTRRDKTEAVETLHAEIDELVASIDKLTEDTNVLSAQVADLDKSMAESTEIRNEEKAKNKATISDAQEAQEAVARAITVIREFYGKAAEATSFIDEPYTGMQDEQGGVTGMLEVIESDFARLEADTDQAESTAQKEYDEFISDSRTDKASKSTALDHKAAKKQDESQALTTKKSDLEGTQKELDASLAYFEKLKPDCVDSGASYEERVSRRKEEIESLQEGLKILTGEEA